MKLEYNSSFLDDKSTKCQILELSQGFSVFKLSDCSTFMLLPALGMKRRGDKHHCMSLLRNLEYSDKMYTSQACGSKLHGAEEQAGG